ncbi:MAG: SOS response-associated peptidase [Patescibacteria group bacterium]|nr:SOS response-associated peptidase [Patescibacteria group bacterium]
MCGRFTLKVLPKELEKRYDVRFKFSEYHPSYNIAPSKMIPIIPNDNPDEIIWMRWGMTPVWWRQKGRGLINIRRESLATKPVFKKLFTTQRCLIPADGFYEWKKIGNKKQPYYFKMKDGAVFSFAGIWDSEVDGTAGSIITCEPNGLVSKIHDRMPCILKQEDEDEWLNCADEKLLLKMLKPLPANGMEGYEVNMRVNSPRNDSSDLIERLSKN